MKNKFKTLSLSPMRFASIILAVLVTILTTIPCDSACGEFTEVESQFHTQDEHGDHSDADNCSPFCVCNCCQTNFVLMQITNELSVAFSTIEHVDKARTFISISSFGLWRPPKA